MDDELIKVGEYSELYRSFLDLNLEDKNIYRSKGLPTHIVNRKHYKVLKYIDYIPDIIAHPDYIGINPNEREGQSIELVKRYKDNVLIGIKLSIIIIEVGNGSRHTLRRVPEMMDTPPIR